METNEPEFCVMPNVEAEVECSETKEHTENQQKHGQNSDCCWAERTPQCRHFLCLNIDTGPEQNEF